MSFYRVFPNEQSLGKPSASEWGGKGSRLIELADLDAPVPPGVVVSTSRHLQYIGTESHSKRNEIAWETANDVDSILRDIESGFGPAIYSVRSGAPISMPGMMDTLLNVGMEEHPFEFWVAKYSERLALDCRRRFLQMYGELVLCRQGVKFQNNMKSVLKSKYGMKSPPLVEEAMGINHYRKLVEKNLATVGGEAILPVSRSEALHDSIIAVWESWDSDRAKLYRRNNGISDGIGTAVVVQAMVFGNADRQSCSGVMFSRCPKTGRDSPMGEFLPRAQGEDVVSGARTPHPLGMMKRWAKGTDAHSQLLSWAERLDSLYGDMQDIEFTVERGKLYLLQTRNGKRTPQAAFRIARDKMSKGTHTLEDVVPTLSGSMYYSMVRPRIADGVTIPPSLKGLGASPGVAKGVPVFSSEQAMAMDKPCILFREETSPEDYGGMASSVAVVTMKGGETSHAAVVSRSMGLPAVVGCALNGGVLEAAHGRAVAVVDGASGKVWLDQDVDIAPADIPEDALAMMGDVVKNHLMDEGPLEMRPSSMNDLKTLLPVIESWDVPIRLNVFDLVEDCGEGALGEVLNGACFSPPDGERVICVDSGACEGDRSLFGDLGLPIESFSRFHRAFAGSFGDLVSWGWRFDLPHDHHEALPHLPEHTPMINGAGDFVKHRGAGACSVSKSFRDKLDAVDEKFLDMLLCEFDLNPKEGDEGVVCWETLPYRVFGR